VVAALRRRVG